MPFPWDLLNFKYSLLFSFVFFFQAFGLGSVAQVVTGQGAYGQYVSINLGFGLGVAMGIHVGGKVSGRTNDSCTTKESPKIR